MVAVDNPQLVQEAINQLTDDKIITTIKRDVANGKTEKPRPFFWLN